MPFIKLSTIVFLTLVPFVSSATTPKKLDYKPYQTQKDASHELVVMALKLPLQNRIDALSKQGVGTFKTLKDLAFDKNQKLQVRWRAVTAIGIINPRGAYKILEQAMESDEWFMRNAGIIAAARGKRKWALGWASKLLDDPALVVRTAAVQTIDKLNGAEVQQLLWKKLYSKENYRGGEGLWIRKHIASTLSKFAQKGQEKKFISLLRDSDKSLHASAIAGLEQITQVKPGKKKTLAYKRNTWLAWAKKYKL